MFYNVFALFFWKGKSKVWQETWEFKINNVSSSQNISLDFVSMYLITHKNNNSFSAKVQIRENSLRQRFFKDRDNTETEKYVRGEKRTVFVM